MCSLTGDVIPRKKAGNLMLFLPLLMPLLLHLLMGQAVVKKAINGLRFPLFQL
jgi:hypothetical protein